MTKITAADRRGDRIEIAPGRGWGELVCKKRTHAVGAQAAEIEVEVGMHRHELADIDAIRPFAQAFRRVAAGSVVIAGDIKTSQCKG